MSTRVTSLPRTGPAIADALAPGPGVGREQFESELRAAISNAASTLDLSPVDEVLDRWWRIAVARREMLSDEESQLLDRIRKGDFSGLQEQQSDGSFRRLA